MHCLQLESKNLGLDDENRRLEDRHNMTGYKIFISPKEYCNVSR